MSDKASKTIAVGDHIRLKTRASNAYKSFDNTGEGVPPLEPADGLVLSIRDIDKGKLVSEAKGDLRRYVFEVVFDATFNIRYASLRNAPRGSENPVTTQAWRRLRAALREAAGQGTFYSTSMPNLLTDSPLATLLDGWKVLKVWSDEIESQERPEPEPKGVIE